MRKLGIGIAIVCGIIIVIVAVFAALFDPNKYRGAIQSQLERRLGRNVTLGNIHLGFFPPRFQLENLSIADDLRFNDVKPFVQAQELDVSPKLLPLLHKSVEINSLNLQRPRVELIKNSQSVWNFSALSKMHSTPRSCPHPSAADAYRYKPPSHSASFPSS
jgi:AsmA protein